MNPFLIWYLCGLVSIAFLWVIHDNEEITLAHILVWFIAGLLGLVAAIPIAFVFIVWCVGKLEKIVLWRRNP